MEGLTEEEFFQAMQNLSPEQREALLRGKDQTVKPNKTPSLVDVGLGYEASKYIKDPSTLLSKAPSLSNLLPGSSAPVSEAATALQTPIPTGFGTANFGPWASGDAYASDLATYGDGSAGGFGIGTGQYGGPALGAALGYDVLANKRHGGRGAAQGAASGALMGSYFGPVGAGVGAVIGGGVGYFGNFGDENRFQDEYKRAEKLREKGLNWGFNKEMPTKGRSKEELIAIEQAKIDAGQQGNVGFANSRDESLLRPDEITGFSALPEALGEKYTNASKQAQEAAAKIILDNKAFREHHGTGDISLTPELRTQVESALGSTMPATKETSPTGSEPKQKEEKKKKKGPSLAQVQFPNLTQAPDLGYRPKIGLSSVMGALNKPSYTSL